MGFSAIERKRRASQNLDIFAQHLSEGKSVTQAAETMGFSKSYGRQMMRAIKTWLGPQAQ